MKFQNLAIFAPLVAADFPPLTIRGEKCPSGIQNSQKLTPETLPKFLGTWYANAHTTNLFQNNKDDCPTANYLATSDPFTIKVDNAQTDVKSMEREHAIGKATFIKNGNLEVVFSPWQEKFSKVKYTNEGNYHILDIDDEHQEFVYVYSCSDRCLFGKCMHTPMFWVMTRSPDNQFMGKSVEQRVDEMVQMYKDAGASDKAVSKVYQKMNFNKFEYCDQEEKNEEFDGNDFWLNKLFGDLW